MGAPTSARELYPKTPKARVSRRTKYMMRRNQPRVIQHAPAAAPGAQRRPEDCTAPTKHTESSQSQPSNIQGSKAGCQSASRSAGPGLSSAVTGSLAPFWKLRGLALISVGLRFAENSSVKNKPYCLSTTKGWPWDARVLHHFRLFIRSSSCQVKWR
jgi:hypothetical protein